MVQRAVEQRLEMNLLSRACAVAVRGRQIPKTNSASSCTVLAIYAIKNNCSVEQGILDMHGEAPLHLV